MKIPHRQFCIFLFSAITAAGLTVASEQAGAQIEPNILLLQRTSGEIELSQHEYMSRLNSVLQATHQSVLSSLEGPSTLSKSRLKAIVVGVGLKLEIGITPILAAAVKPRYRLVYTRKGSHFFPNAL